MHVLCSVRLERLREVREAAHKGESAPGPAPENLSSAGNDGKAEAEKPASALELAGLQPEMEVAKLKLPKKRKVADTVAMLERAGDSDSDGEEEEEELSWRAKKTAK